MKKYRVLYIVVEAIFINNPFLNNIKFIDSQ